MEIRTATKNDLNELMQFYDFMCQELGKTSFQPNGNKGGYPSSADVIKAIESNFQFIGIEDNKIIAAYILDDKVFEEYKSGNWIIKDNEKVITLHALRVHPEYSGRGYAKKLMNHSFAVSKERGYKAMRLDVMKGNELAIKIYKKYGFKECGITKITYPDIGYPTDVYLMELDLTDVNIKIL